MDKTHSDTAAHAHDISKHVKVYVGVFIALLLGTILTVSMYYADPDGNQMEFQVDVYPTAEELQAYIAGPKFGVNPIGVEYDPVEWLARLRAGTPVSELLVRESDEPVSPLRGLITA